MKIENCTLKFVSNCENSDFLRLKNLFPHFIKAFQVICLRSCLILEGDGEGLRLYDYTSLRLNFKHIAICKAPKQDSFPC